MTPKKEKIKIKFTDFWAGFLPEKNFFTELLSKKYIVEIDDHPELLIYSCFGREYLSYDCPKLFYSAEHVMPDFTGCDYAITFNYIEDSRHFRMPLYAMYLSTALTDRFCKGLSEEEARGNWRAKTKFCCMVVSNEGAKERLALFEKLSSYKRVDSGGRVLNNVGGPVADKREFIKDYRFVISFENASRLGYTTEKIVEPYIVNSIPLYWGDPLVSNEFNLKSMLVLNDSKTLDDFVKEIIAIDNDEALALQILMQPKFTNGVLPASVKAEEILEFFSKILLESKHKKPVSRTWLGSIHFIKVKLVYYLRRMGGVIRNLETKR